MAEFKYFELGGIKIEYSTLLNMLDNDNISQNYGAISYQCRGNTYILNYQDKKAYVYKNPIQVIIQIGKNERNLIIHSDIDIEKYCKDNNLNIADIYYENEELFINEEKILNFQNEIKLFYKERKDLPSQKRNNVFDKNHIYKASEYSKYYQYYFGYDIDGDTEFIYKMTNTRNKIYKNLDKLSSTNCTKFKFTGPFNIGKSLTLLQYSRIYQDVFYINLKVLKLLFVESETDCYLLLKEEFSRINKTHFDAIQKLINEKYKEGTNPTDLIFKIIDTLSASSMTFLFIFDQYKSNSFPIIYQEKLEKLNNNIKIVYCSSINNYSIRKECINSWKKDITCFQKLNLENQNYYFYYEDIYSEKFGGNEEIINQIKKIKRFNKYYLESDSDDVKISKVNNHISQKIKEFAKENNTTLDFVLMNIKSLLNKNYNIDDIEFVLEYCPLKYFLIEFDENNYFKVKIQFPFIIPIINRKLLKDEVNDYFKNSKYLKKLIENETIKGNYFEEAVKIGLRENIELPLKIDESIEIKEIATMEEINMNDFDYNFLEEQNEEDDDDEEKMDIEYSDMNQNIQNIENDMDIEEDIEQANIVKIIPTKIDKEKRKELDNFLKKYNLNNKKNPKVIKNSLEWYRQNEIKNLYSGEYEIKKSGKNYNGDKTYFLDQRKRTGKTLDCGLLYGEKNDKTFIGFQCKCYFDETKSLPKKAKDKDIIKENIKDILINSLYLLNCKITKWYYYLIFYYNPKKKKCNVSESIIEGITGIIEVLFYEPLEKKFYDINHQPLFNLEITDIANLDIKNINFGMISLNISHIYAQKCDIILDEKKVENSFVTDFNYFGKNNIDEIIIRILNIMEISNETYTLKHKIVKLPKIFTFPSYNNIYLYKRNKNKGFIGVKSYKDYRRNEIIKFYDLVKGCEINYFENDCQYMYTLYTKRKRSIKKTDSIPIQLQKKQLKENS